MSAKAFEVFLPKMSDEKCTSTWHIPAVGRLCAGKNLGGKGICSVSVFKHESINIHYYLQ